MHIETPLIESPALSACAQRSIWLKLEAVQPPGSFKIRGIGFACTEYARRGAQRLVCSSGGNAGIAVAYAGRHLSLRVTVVVPETTTERARMLIRQEGAELLVHGASWQEANALALSLIRKTDAFIHPFDDPLLWNGHATMIDEAARVIPKPEAIVVAVGGGGLLCGVIQGLHRNNWADVPVIAVETEGAASLAESLRHGFRVTLDRIDSIATSLGAKQICEQAFEYATHLPVSSVVVSDKSAALACGRFLGDHRILVEPACGAALALAYENAKELASFNRVMVVVCGGATTTPELLNEWLKGLT